jgi:hypothetical protein
MDPKYPSTPCSEEAQQQLRAQQIAAGGHGGLGAIELASYRHGQEQAAQLFETAVLTLRREALQHAVNLAGRDYDGEAVLMVASKFEAYLKGESATE